MNGTVSKETYKGAEAETEKLQEEAKTNENMKVVVKKEVKKETKSPQTNLKTKKKVNTEVEKTETEEIILD
ncbi:MAG: hypothetical protein ACI9XP_001452 [Lentimonas sp.]